MLYTRLCARSWTDRDGKDGSYPQNTQSELKGHASGKLQHPVMKPVEGVCPPCASCPNNNQIGVGGVGIIFASLNIMKA